MKLHFCTTNKFVSRAIRWMFNEPASHFAIEFDGKLVIHSSFLGASIDWLQWFVNDRTIVSALVPVEPMLLIEEEAYYQRMLMKRPKRPGYDFKAFMYFTYCGLMYKFFKKPLPNKNPYNDNEYFLCTEEARLFELVDPDKIDTAITTPWMLRQYFLDTGKFVEEKKD